MHKIDTKRSYNIVKCQDPFCNICTHVIEEQLGSAPPQQGMIVYTCSNPSCSLCDGDYSLLLDLMSPTVSPGEESFLDEMCGDWLADIESEQRPFSGEPTASTENHKRKCSAPVQSEIKTKKRSCVEQHGAGLGVNQHTRVSMMTTQGLRLKQYEQSVKQHASKCCNSDEFDNVDDVQLMNLASELELDKIQRLPELRKDIITDFWE